LPNANSPVLVVFTGCSFTADGFDAADGDFDKDGFVFEVMVYKELISKVKEISG
jgi:hypothetical protein